jgi:hypothetical protein
MNRIRRDVSAVVNPVSTAVTRWWCSSAIRRMLTGHGPTARQRRMAVAQRRMAWQMEARARAIDDLLNSGAPDPPGSAGSFGSGKGRGL